MFEVSFQNSYAGSDFNFPKINRPNSSLHSEAYGFSVIITSFKEIHKADPLKIISRHLKEDRSENQIVNAVKSICRKRSFDIL